MAKVKVKPLSKFAMKTKMSGKLASIMGKGKNKY